MNKFQIKTLSAVLAAAAAFTLAAGCGSSEKKLVPHTLAVRIGGFYSLTSKEASDEEKNMLRTAAMGLDEKTKQWVEFAVAATTPNPEDSTVSEAVLFLDKKVEGNIRTEESAFKVKYYKLEVRAYLDANGDGMYTAGEKFVDGYYNNDYDNRAGALYFFVEDSISEGATYGWNYKKSDGAYTSDLELIKSNQPVLVFSIQTIQAAAK